MSPIEKLKLFAQCRPTAEEGFSPELSGYAAQAAARVLLENWETALAEGSTNYLVTDIDDVIRELNVFRAYAREVLPRVNGGKLVFSAEQKAAEQ